MNPYIIISGVLGIVIGYYLGRENTIKLCRRLYKLGVDMDMVFIEHAERDIMFNKNIVQRETKLRIMS